MRRRPISTFLSPLGGAVKRLRDDGRPVHDAPGRGNIHPVTLPRPAAALLSLLAVGCASPRTAAPDKPAGAERRQLLACLGAPPDAIYEPERLAVSAEPALAVHTFPQQTASCGAVVRRYVAYVPRSLGARSNAPVVIVLHGQGASAEAMMTFQTRGAFNRLADQRGFVVVYGNGLPTRFNIEGLPNSGRWQSEDGSTGSGADDLDYLRRIDVDLQARGVTAGGNDVYLVGHSNGGGMALSAARRRPDSYTGVAAFMPFVGFSPPGPTSLAGSRLRRVLFAYSTADPGLPPDYAAQVLEPLTRAWAQALGVADGDIDAPAQTALATTVTARDLRSANGALRELVFDQAGHFWPTRDSPDPPALVAQYGRRNQQIEGAEEVWRFFRD